MNLTVLTPRVWTLEAAQSMKEGSMVVKTVINQCTGEELLRNYHIFSLFQLSSMVNNKPDHHCCKNKKQKWILKSRDREKIKMQVPQLRPGYLAKMIFFHKIFIIATIFTKYGVKL